MFSTSVYFELNSVIFTFNSLQTTGPLPRAGRLLHVQHSEFHFQGLIQGGPRGANAPQEFQSPSQAYNTINNLPIISIIQYPPSFCN